MACEAAWAVPEGCTLDQHSQHFCEMFGSIYVHAGHPQGPDSVQRGEGRIYTSPVRHWHCIIARKDYGKCLSGPRMSWIQIATSKPLDLEVVCRISESPQNSSSLHPTALAEKAATASVSLLASMSWQTSPAALLPEMITGGGRQFDAAGRPDSCMTEGAGFGAMNDLSSPGDSIKENVARVRRLRKALEDWRELLAPLHGVLVWRQEYHPPLLAAVVSLVFIVVWYLDPPLLTLVAVLGMTATSADYLVPALCQALFRQQDWTASNEREFERMCELLSDLTSGAEHLWLQLAGWKQERPKLYFVGMFAALLTLAWVGNNINNLFLCYLLAQWVVMYPGMKQRGLIKKYTAEAILFVTSKIRPKTADGARLKTE